MRNPQKIKRSLGILLLLASIVFALVSCQSDDDVSIPVTISYVENETIAKNIRDNITSSGNGWEATLTPRLGKVYHLFLKFGVDGKVNVFADADTVASFVETTSAYSIEATLHQAILSFSQGSNLDRIPGLEKNNGIDKTYTVKFNSENSIVLSGNLYGDQLVLQKATAPNENEYTAGKLKLTMKRIQKYLPSIRLLYFEPVPGTKIQFIVRYGLRSAYFTYVENEKAQFYGSDFAYTFDGVRLKNPVVIHGVDISELRFDLDVNKFYVLHEGDKLFASDSEVPLIPLHYLMGNEFPSGIAMQAPWIGSQPGWSYKFLEQWTVADNALNEKEYGLSLLYMIMDVDMDEHTMNLQFYTFDIYSHVKRATLKYTFTKSTEGVFDFDPLPIDLSSTEGQYADAFKKELSALINLIDTHTFHVEFYDNGDSYMPQYQSLQDSEVYFTGSFY
jgi:hypothetical protein